MLIGKETQNEVKTETKQELFELIMSICIWIIMVDGRFRFTFVMHLKIGYSISLCKMCLYKLICLAYLYIISIIHMSDDLCIGWLLVICVGLLILVVLNERSGRRSRWGQKTVLLKSVKQKKGTTGSRNCKKTVYSCLFQL